MSGMDPIADKKNSDLSSDDDEEESVMSKIGSFLFFGCGNGKDKEKSTMM